jgi:hypothetical protein
MLSSRRMGSAFASKAALVFVAVGAGCSADSQGLAMKMDVAGADASRAPTLPSAGISGGVSGQIAVTAGVGGTTSTTTSGSSGMVAQGGNAAGGVGGTAPAGTAGQAGVAGTLGKAGSGGAAGASVATAGAGGAGANNPPAAGCAVSPITTDMRSRYKNMNDDYYQKFASANEVVVATGPEVSDEAVVRYCRLLTEMFSNEKVRQALVAEKMWFTMIDEKEQLSSLPQISKEYGTSLNARARGLGGLTPTICAEDSIMCLPGDKWKGDCICPHETGHTLYSSGIAKVPDLSSRLTSITSAVRSSGRIANSYVWMDGNESGMMAWGVQVWYDCAINGTNGAYHPDINTRAELQKELPDFYQFLSELLPADNKYEDCYSNP